MKNLFLLVLALLFAASMPWAQNVVMGVEANGPDSATIKAYEWRSVNVYQNIYGKAGFKVVLISQSSKSKVEAALKDNDITHITGCGHGSPTLYTGYSQGTVFTTSDATLLAKLKGTHIHLLSCLTAQKLGPAMMQYGAKSYAGYIPSFYFTWKSATEFFKADAAIDEGFAQGKTAPECYTQTIKAFNDLIEYLNKNEPSGVQHAITDRDGLSCLPKNRKVLDYVLPLEMASYTLYTKNSENGEFVNFADFQNLNLRASYRDMSREDFKAMVIAGYERLDRDFELGILGYGKLHRDQIVEEIRQDTEIGQQLVEVNRHFLQAMENCRWSKTIEAQTDGEGNISNSGTFDVPMTITIKSIKAVWSGQPSSFENVNVQMNNEVLYNGAVQNGTTYEKVLKVQKGPANCSIQAVGGPKNTTIKVTINFSLG